MPTIPTLIRATALCGTLALLACVPPSEGGRSSESSGSLADDEEQAPVERESPPAPGCGRLLVGGSLGGFSMLGSCRKNAQGESAYWALLDEAGRLVTAALGQGTYWSNGTPGGARATVTEAGSLEVYDEQGQLVWTTGTDGSSGASLIMRDDGELVLATDADTLWSSGAVRSE